VPLYEYECRKCHQRFEEIQKVDDRPIKKCPKCKSGRVERLISAPAVRFKGTGWYVTDYAGKGKSDSKSETGDTSSSKSEKSDTGAKESKPDKAKKP
jgi:putative FmdB family regulatory protein